MCDTKIQIPLRSKLRFFRVSFLLAINESNKFHVNRKVEALETIPGSWSELETSVPNSRPAFCTHDGPNALVQNYYSMKNGKRRGATKVIFKFLKYANYFDVDLGTQCYSKAPTADCETQRNCEYIRWSESSRQQRSWGT